MPRRRRHEICRRPSEATALITELTAMQQWLSEVLGDAISYVRSGGDPYEIVAYRGFANDERALVQGRVLESPNVAPAAAEDSLWRNLVNTLKRVESDPVAGARVLVVTGGYEREVVADDEGFFREWIDLPPMSPSELPWREVELRLIAPLRPSQPDVRATALLRVPEKSATFGVISDLDD